MTNQAQLGTWFWRAMLGVALSACSEATVVNNPDAGVAKDAEVPQEECQTQHDCAMVYKGCCGPCEPPTRDEVVAVPKSRQAAVAREYCGVGVTCGACYEAVPDPLGALLVPACVEHRCELVDLREDDSSSCVSDSDCEAVSRGCCPSSSQDPVDYVGLHRGADTTLLECSPALPCEPPGPHTLPITYCAADGHCAVRRRDTVNDKESSECWSPTQNLERAGDADARACDCVPGSRELCRTDNNGRRVGLWCKDNNDWEVLEGPRDPCNRM